jgi:hypothetical protein
MSQLFVIPAMNLLQPGQIPLKAPAFEVPEIGRFVPFDRTYLKQARPIFLPMLVDITSADVSFSFADKEPFYLEDCLGMETMNPNARGVRIVDDPIDEILFRRAAPPEKGWNCLPAQDAPGSRMSFLRLGSVMANAALNKQNKLHREAALRAQTG